jgi:tRNA dimethylallyltransferase
MVITRNSKLETRNSGKLPWAIFLMGPTASGKTKLAMEISSRLPCELISVDSAMIYRCMNVGTAKPNPELLAKVPHHLIDIIDPTQSYSAAQFRQDALALMQDISARGKIPLLVGGTMLYFKALKSGLSDLPEANPQTRAVIDAMAKESGWPTLHRELARLDPATATRIEPNDAQRIQRALEIYYLSGKPMSELIRDNPGSELPYRLIRIALIPSDRAILHRHIAQRFDAILEAGLVEEVRDLRHRYSLKPNMPAMRCVGYRQAWQYIEKEYDSKTLRDKGIAATRQLAKRQLTWLRSMNGVREFDSLIPGTEKHVIDFLRGALEGCDPHGTTLRKKLLVTSSFRRKPESSD